MEACPLGASQNYVPSSQNSILRRIVPRRLGRGGGGYGVSSSVVCVGGRRWAGSRLVRSSCANVARTEAARRSIVRSSLLNSMWRLAASASAVITVLAILFSPLLPAGTSGRPARRVPGYSATFAGHGRPGRRSRIASTSAAVNSQSRPTRWPTPRERARRGMRSRLMPSSAATWFVVRASTLVDEPRAVRRVGRPFGQQIRADQRGVIPCAINAGGGKHVGGSVAGVVRDV